MKTFKNILILGASCLFFSACYNLRDPLINKDASLETYEYVIIPETKELTSGSGALYGGDYTYAAMSNKSVNPGDVIEGILMKKGYKSLDSIRPEFIDQTLIIKYGESGRRSVGLGGYTIEVTIYFYDAKTYKTIFSCTAEGIGSTEADDIREAIERCLSGLD